MIKAWILVAGAAVQTILTAATPSPTCGTFQGCPEEGQPPSIWAVLKNRCRPVDCPSTFSVKDAIAWPASRSMADGVKVIGWLVAAQRSDTESCNCNLRSLRDTHLWLGDRANARKKDCMVVETTPRWQAFDTTLAWPNVGRFVGKKVSVTGYPFLDPEHSYEVGRTRATQWEVHPVTRIEVVQ